MICKTFEIRDTATFIPMLAVKLAPGCEADRYLLARAGFGRIPVDQAGYVLLCQINGGEGLCKTDPYDWPEGTYREAQQYITQMFDQLESGAVIDIEFILGKTKQPKLSESNSSWSASV
jgi:hypothetical protein